MRRKEVSINNGTKPNSRKRNEITPIVDYVETNLNYEKHKIYQCKTRTERCNEHGTSKPWNEKEALKSWSNNAESIMLYSFISYIYLYWIIAKK